MSLAVRQDNGLPFRADLEVGMGCVLHTVHPVLAGAEHNIVSVGRDCRVIREAPFQRLTLIVAQSQARQGNLTVCSVIKFDPVAQFVVIIPQAGDWIRHHLVDDNGAVGYGDALPVHPVAFLGVFITGAEPGNHFKSVHRQRIAFIAGHDRIFAAVNQVSVLIVQIYRLDGAGKLEFGVECLIDISLVGVVAEHHHPAVSFQADIGEQEFDPVSPIAQAQAFQVDNMIRTVPDLNPVGIFAVFVRHSGIVGGHDLTDHQSIIRTDDLASVVPDQTGFRSDGIGRATGRLLRCNQDHDRNQRSKTGQENKVHPDLPAAQFSGTGNRTASLGIRILIHGFPLLPDNYKSYKLYHKEQLSANSCTSLT